MLVGQFNLKSPLQKNSVPLIIKIRSDPKSKRSKVIYELDVKYTIYSNGTTSYNRKAVNSLITMIKNISTTKDLNASISHLKVNSKNLIAIIDDPFIVTKNNQTLSTTNQKKSAAGTPRVKAYTASQKTKPRKSQKFAKKLRKIIPKKMSKKKKKLTAKLNTDKVKVKKTFKSPKTISLGKDQKVERVVSFEKKSNNLKNIEYIEKMLSSLKELRPSE